MQTSIQTFKCLRASTYRRNLFDSDYDVCEESGISELDSDLADTNVSGRVWAVMNAIGFLYVWYNCSYIRIVIQMIEIKHIEGHLCCKR